MVQSTRRFTHDCDKCKFLGQIGPDDVYICSIGENLVLRHGNDGPDYASFPKNIVEMIIHQPGTANARWVLARQMADEAS